MLSAAAVDEVEECGLSVVLRRKSCVTAMPMEAKESEVRSQARNVRSVTCVSICESMFPHVDVLHD